MASEKTSVGEQYRNGPAPPHIKKVPVLRYLWRQMHVNNKNAMICLIGDTGDGKSWGALRLAELLDPGFHADKVAFRPTRLLERINEDHPTGDITIADEAGVSMNAKTWWESDQINIGNILETWRHQNRGLIFTLPMLQKLQKDARGLIDVLLSAYGINRRENISTWRFQMVETNNKTGETYEPYPRLPNPETGVVERYETLELYPPTKELRKTYQQRKEEYTDEINQQGLDDLKEEEAEEEKSAKEIAVEIADGSVAQFISEHGTTGNPYINKDLIRAEYGISHSNARTVKAILDRQIDVSQYETE